MANGIALTTAFLDLLILIAIIYFNMKNEPSHLIGSIGRTHFGYSEEIKLKHYLEQYKNQLKDKMNFNSWNELISYIEKQILESEEAIWEMKRWKKAFEDANKEGIEFNDESN